jgi:hypothetical protein
MNRIAGVMAIHAKNRFYWFFQPWIIVLSSFAINFFIALLLGGKVAIYTGGLASIYVFMFVLGIIVLNDTFPFAIGFSVSRTDYFLGTMATMLASSTITTILLWLLALIEHSLTKDWGVSLHFFYLPYLNDGTLIEQFCVYFLIVLHMYFLGFVLASIYQRFGKNGMYAFFAIAVLLTSAWAVASTYLQWWTSMYNSLARYSAFELAVYSVPLIVGYALVAYALLRKATIR